jgi:hypothetical protein
MDLDNLTDADRQMLNALATQVVLDRLNRGVVVGHTKGRVIMDFTQSEQTAAERMWFDLQRKLNKGGYKPKETT